jgi:nucleoside-diphosphate-sugar epimerase
VPDHIAFLDGVTGYLGRWTLFWLLDELPDERVAVLIRPSGRGAGADPDVRHRLDQVLASIGMSSERHRVTPVAGDLGTPLFGNPEAVDSLRAPVWMHIAGDVRFKKLGTQTSSVINRDHTATFLDAASRARCRPGTVCHTSTFYAFEKAGPPEATFTVPEDFLDPAEMQHHNAYGLSKLEAETLLRDEVRRGSLPFTVLIFRPDIIAHHVPAPAVARRNPGLLVDDFRVMYGLLASLAGLDGQPFGYLPLDASTRLYTSDVDSVTRAMAHLALLYGDGSLDAPGGYRIFNLVNRWHPLTCADLKSICAEIAPQATASVRHFSPAEFREAVWPRLSPAERLYYSTFVEPFAGYLSRPRTDPCTEHADSVLGEDWHLLHPRHGKDVRAWMRLGAQRALEQRFGAPAAA